MSRRAFFIRAQSASYLKYWETTAQHHQYVITTHSSSLVSMTEMDRLFLVRREPESSASSVVAIDYNSQNDLGLALADVGVRLNDVYGADSILWVEGKTEEVCFPELIQHVAKIPLQGVQILGVVSTDELSSKHTTRVSRHIRALVGYRVAASSFCSFHPGPLEQRTPEGG